MNDVKIIRKGSYKDYLYNGVFGGFFVAFVWFLILLIDHSVISSLWIAIGIWVGLIILFMGIGFPIEEYVKRKNQIKYLQSPKYSFIHKNDFLINDDLFFEGIYQGFYIRIFPTSRRHLGIIGSQPHGTTVLIYPHRPPTRPSCPQSAAR
jgi:hypothetical protein